ncbi:unnamed protein product [Cuscuta campestris]|uniref:Glycosyl transferase CAP10 domain-containing protein n=1 Tax=Cuscuta campestris TaxID=132261 RepID=A0A484LHR6_9ASTE|nr:unnamed protein product [Cuscuta campestris]
MKEKLMKCNKHYRSFLSHKLAPPIIQTKRLAAVTAAALLLLLYIIATKDAAWPPLANMKSTDGDDVVYEFPLDCDAWNKTNTCPRNYPTSSPPENLSPAGGVPGMCPEYFRWIHEDLKPWKETGITRPMVEKARRSAHFRLVVSGGRMYVEEYRKSIQSRALFSMWGMVQLLRWYPGKLPDLELMFDCDDRPVVRAKDYRNPSSGPPPVFRYCSDERSLDIVFPDWSFWGWAETNIKPWRSVTKDIKEGNKRRKWKDRVPLAYWKGNPKVTPSRADLIKCNLTRRHNFNTLLYVQDWKKEARRGYKQSSLGDQCTHRYKIYIEGWAWSVSEKYIMACDSPTLYVASRFHDFFVRGMVPLHHYWPINKTSKCKSLQFAVHWGNNNNHTSQVSYNMTLIHLRILRSFVYSKRVRVCEGN